MDLEGLIKAGRELGFDENELRSFVIEQQAIEREELELVLQERIKQSELQQEQERRELELNKTEQELEMKEKDIEEREKERKHELPVIQLRQDLPTGAPHYNFNGVPKPKLPKFDENLDDIDAYIERFERYATTHKWPVEQWVVNLCSLLSGKALQAYIALPPTNANNYDSVKKAILKRYVLTEEGYRTKFRVTVPEKGENVSQYVARITRFFDRWVDLAGIGGRYEDLKDFMLREQFQRRCHSELRLFLKERKPKTLGYMKELTETYLAAHGGSMWKGFPRLLQREGKPSVPTVGEVGLQSSQQSYKVPVQN